MFSFVHFGSAGSVDWLRPICCMLMPKFIIQAMAPTLCVCDQIIFGYLREFHTLVFVISSKFQLSHLTVGRQLIKRIAWIIKKNFKTQMTEDR